MKYGDEAFHLLKCLYKFWICKKNLVSKDLWKLSPRWVFHHSLGWFSLILLWLRCTCQTVGLLQSAVYFGFLYLHFGHVVCFSYCVFMCVPCSTDCSSVWAAFPLPLQSCAVADREHHYSVFHHPDFKAIVFPSVNEERSC